MNTTTRIAASAVAAGMLAVSIAGCRCSDRADIARARDAGAPVVIWMEVHEWELEAPGGGEPGVFEAAAGRAEVERDGPTIEPATRLGVGRIEVSDQAGDLMARQNIEAVRVRARVCVSEAGIPTRVDILDGSDLEAVDERVRSEMMKWRYVPRRVNGMPAPFCERVTFQLRLDYVDRASPAT